jgi:dTDP-4-dehydrorhamnose reductase
LLALNWANLVCQDFDVILGLHEREVSIKGAESLKISLESEIEFSKYVDIIKPDLVVHTAGMTNVDQCEAFPELANKINYEAAKFVSDVCLKNNIDLIFISTDHLFDGSVPNVSENHVKNPLNCYGQTKSLGEDYIHLNNPNALIIRTNFYGWGTTYRNSFSDFIYYKLKNKQPVQLFFDVFYTPILIEKLVEIIEKLVALNSYGIFNIVSDDRISKFNFGIILADVFGFDHSLISPVSINTRNDLVMRPSDMSLNNEKATNLVGIPFGKVNSHLILLKKQLSDNRYKEITLL